jgi:N-glycosylase/DNA lyase
LINANGAALLKIRLDVSCPLNLKATLCCGQAFRWDKRAEWWYGVVRDNVFKIRQVGDRLEFENADADSVNDYFGLHDDLPRIYSLISKDKQIRQAIEMFKGLRILRQDPWECLISYICATYKSIPAIKQMISSLSQKLGNEVRFDGYDFYTFPTAEKLAKASLAELSTCYLGYRAKYIRETAIVIHENDFELECLRKMPYDKAKKQLLDFSGVGSKVADCVLLFSLGKSEAFPIDVWLKRAILRRYSSHFPREFIMKIRNKESLTSTEYEKLNLFGREHFGAYAGYAQEYLYHYERTNP